MTRETYALTCVSSGCRFARVYLRSREEAEAIARQHAGPGHVVELAVETVRTVARFGESRR